MGVVTGRVVGVAVGRRGLPPLAALGEPNTGEMDELTDIVGLKNDFWWSTSIKLDHQLDQPC